jgi:putative ABC transport system permease protein
MMRLLLAMISARRGAALTVLVLAAVVSASAAAGPLYRSAADRAAATVEVEAASPRDRAIKQTTVVHRDDPSAPPGGELTPTLPYQPGLDTVLGLVVGGRVRTAAGQSTVVNMTFRTGACRHLAAVTGRCVGGANEVMLSTRTAQRLGVAAGDPLYFQSGSADAGGFSLDVDASTGQPFPPVPLTVTGTYRPPDRREPYWADRDIVAGPADTEQVEDAIFVTQETVAGVHFANAVVSVDQIARRAAFDDPDALRAVADNATSRGVLGQSNTDSGIPDLLGRIAAGQDSLGDAVQLAAVPLVLLCWFVLYLAVANSAFRRRAEAGLAGLRGVPRLTRWWLSTAEYAIPVLAGAALGYLAGLLVMSIVADRTLPGSPPVTVDADSAWYALAAVGGALAVGLFAQWRAIAAPVATLLRRVPARRPAGRLGAVEVVAVALAVAAGYQIRTSDSGAGGLALLAPMFIALAVGLLAARLVGLVADRAGRRALRRGALGRALACLYLARQPSQARLLGALVTLFAVLGFAVTATDVGAAARTARVQAEVGAPRVLTVSSVSSRELLAAVRAADPEGRYAMAAVPMSNSKLPLLAVDSTRLARVAIWHPGYGPSAAEAAHLLRPSEPTEVRLTGTAIEVRATVAAAPAKATLLARLLPARGRPVDVDLGELHAGTASYRASTKDCAAGGCRLLGLSYAIAAFARVQFDLTVHEIRQYGPDAVVVGPTGRWLPGDGSDRAAVEGAPAGDGYRITYSGGVQPKALLRPAGSPSPVPVLAAEPVPASIPNGDSPITVARAAALTVVPGMGRRGALIDLAYADLATLTPTPAADPEVWLAADAPPAVLDRLRDAGLVTVSERSVRARADLLDRGGPALALRFYLLVAAAAVALGVAGVAVVAAADRWGQTGALRALRDQGMSPAVAWKVGFGGYAVLTMAALVLGTGAAAAAWWLARTVIPFFTDGAGGDYVPATPDPVVAVAALAGATAVLIGTAAVAAAGLRRAVERRQS